MAITLSITDETGRVATVTMREDAITLTEVLDEIPGLLCSWGYLPGSFPNAIRGIIDWVDTLERKEN